MGNAPQPNASSLIVEHSRNNSELKPAANYPKYYYRSQSNNAYKNLNEVRGKNSGLESKLKVVSSSKAIYGRERVQEDKNKNSIYFSMQRLQNQGSKHRTREIAKNSKQQYRCSTAEKHQKLTLASSNDKKQSKLLSSQSKHKLFEKASRPLILSHGGSASKRKPIGIKQSSLNKSPKNVKNYKNYYSSPNNNQNPGNKDQKEIIKSYNLEQPERSDLLKSTKNKEKVSSVHQFYFQKSGSKLQTTKQKPKTPNQNEAVSLYIPIQSHKNPMGKQKLSVNEKKQKQAIKLPENENLLIDSCYNSTVKQFYPNPTPIQTHEKIDEFLAQIIVKEKQYSICEDSAHNLSKMSIKQIESEIRMEPSEINPNHVNFIIDESIIIRGANQQ